MSIDRIKFRIVAKLNQAILDNKMDAFHEALKDLDGHLNQTIIADAIGFAIFRKNLDVVKILLNEMPNFDIETKNGQNNTPLMLASASSSKEIFDLFIEYGADITSKNSKNQTALDIAIENKEKHKDESYFHGYSDEIIDCLEVLNSIKKINNNRRDSKQKPKPNRSF